MGHTQLAMVDSDLPFVLAEQMGTGQCGYKYPGLCTKGTTVSKAQVPALAGFGEPLGGDRVSKGHTARETRSLRRLLQQKEAA